MPRQPNTQQDANAMGDEDSNRDRPFRFLDLPPEIRKSVYAYTTSGRASRDMSYFRIPAIALASRQLRQESLPVLFAENHFRLYLACNFCTPYDKSTRARGRIAKDAQKVAGTLGFNRIISKFIRAAGNEAALFRDVKLEVHDAHMIHIIRDRQHREGSIFSGAVSLHLHVREKKLNVFAQDEFYHPCQVPSGYRPSTRSLMHEKAIDEAVKKASDVAREIAAGDGFKGFTVADLRKVAQVFRFS